MATKEYDENPSGRHSPIFMEQGGHCLGNQRNRKKVKKNERGLTWSGKSQEILTGCPNMKV